MGTLSLIGLGYSWQGEGRADEVEDCAGKATGLTGDCQCRQRCQPDLLIGPAKAMADGDGGGGRVVEEEFCLGGGDVFGRQVEGEAGLVGSETGEFLGWGKGNAATHAGQDNTLYLLGQGEFHPQAGSGQLVGTDTGDDFKGDIGF